MTVRTESLPASADSARALQAELGDPQRAAGPLTSYFVGPKPAPRKSAIEASPGAVVDTSAETRRPSAR